MLHKEKESTDIYLRIAKNIKKYRLHLRMTQAQLANRSGYSYAYIRRLEGPKCIKNYSIQTLLVLSKSLNIDIKYLFEEE